MAVKKWPPKDPGDSNDFPIDWTNLLEGDTIVGVAHDVPVGLVLLSEEFTDTVTRAWLSGGTLGQSYNIDITVTTAGGRTLNCTGRLKIADRRF